MSEWPWTPCQLKHLHCLLLPLSVLKYPIVEVPLPPDTIQSQIKPHDSILT